MIIKQASSTKAEVHKTVYAHDHIPRPLVVSIESRLAIDKMFQVMNSLRPSKILENLDNANEAIVTIK